MINFDVRKIKTLSFFFSAKQLNNYFREKNPYLLGYNIIED